MFFFLISMLRLPARGAKQMTGAQGGMHARTCARTHTYSTSSDTHRRFIDWTRHIAGCRSTLMEDLHLIRCTEWGRTFGSTKKKKTPRWNHYPRACFFETQRKQHPCGECWKDSHMTASQCHPNTHKMQHLKLEAPHKAFPDVTKSVFTAMTPL